jgi:predicted outer membrane repeat protein
MRRYEVLTGLGLALALACTAGGKIIYVDDDANAPGDGKSWATPYRYLQDALADAKTAEKPVEIRVAQGIYTPDHGAGQTRGDRNASFCLMNGVSLLGGYVGIGVADSNARQIEVYKTILSGDLAGNDVIVDDPCDLEDEPSRAENSYHVVRAFMLDGTPVLEGFTITAGNANGDPPSDRYKGGGLLCELSKNLLLAKCTFRENFAQSGGGMFNYSSNPRLTSCSFIGNAASGAGGFGGGMAGVYRSSPTVNNCTFRQNYAVGGGGISNTSGEPKFALCDLTRNRASMGGAVYIDTSLISFENCRFSLNSASIGGAAATMSPRCLLSHCLFEGNSAEVRGGAIAASAGNNITVSNCTLSGNASPKGNAFSLERRQNVLRIVSSILWDGGDEIRDESNSPIMIAYSNVLGGWEGVGNLDVDPRFGDPSRGDYHPKSQGGRWDPVSQTWIMDDVTSPCIDGGDPNGPIGYEPFPNGGRINMGAYGGTPEASKSYYGKTPCAQIVAGDIDGDCQVNLRDLVILASHWLEER